MLALWIWSQAPHRNELHIRWFGAKYVLASDRGELLLDNSPEIDDRVSQQVQDRERLEQQQKLYAQRGDWPKLKVAQMQFRTVSDSSLPAAIRYSTPNWCIALAALVLPALWLRKWSQQRRLVSIGLCPQCGYDLRASKERCPECGIPIAARAFRGERLHPVNGRATRT